jgi:cation:H+ antiporter
MATLHLLLGLVGLLIGSDIAVRGSVSLAHRWGWPSWVTGLLLLALGTSLPELFVCIASAPQYPGLAVGNIFGSNAFNVGMVLGLTLLLKGDARLNVRSVRLATLAPLMVCTGLAFLLPGMGLESYWTTSVMLVGYLIMVLISIAGRKELQVHDDAAPPTDWPVSLALAATLSGFLLLAYASQWFLDGALTLADMLGWKEGFAGFVITAVGTSAPELFTSMRALRLGHAGAVFGNVVGSNAFNLMVAGGFVGLLAEVEVPQEGLMGQLWVNLGFMLVLLVPTLFTTPRRELSVRAYQVMGTALGLAYFLSAWAIQ